MALIVRCLGFGVNELTIDGTWTKAINGHDSERFAFNDLSVGLITGYVSQPGPNKYIRSGKCRRLAMLT
ncbi:hypothetical protein [Leptothoe spongobia]|uniref:Uncharacterized protein n=1 Tax=Leptothoe spongobia TAU-MAC 1115 TaxID=1967444 RepID=A0A947DH45_9CYAN|nr:hypothetical protein [Leptothoe spongobia]MBT9316987.1 hypothetical protein [Leptothoe spongobia TAU-MAC 1115]